MLMLFAWRRAQVDTVMLDKTGTLTEGRLRLVGAATAPGGATAAELLALAAAVEATTRHPLADAVAAAAAHAGLPSPSPRAEDAATEPGCGVRGRVGGREVAVGALGWVLERCTPRAAGGDAAATAASPDAPSGPGGAAAREPARGRCADGAASEAGDAGGTESRALSSSSGGGGAADAGEWEARVAAAGLAGCTTVFVGEAGRGVLGALGFRDALRPDAAATVARLRGMGLRVGLLSGDGAAAVAAAAAEAGIEVWRVLCGMRGAIAADMRGHGCNTGVVSESLGCGTADPPVLTPHPWHAGGQRVGWHAAGGEGGGGRRAARGRALRGRGRRRRERRAGAGGGRRRHRAGRRRGRGRRGRRRGARGRPPGPGARRLPGSCFEGGPAVWREWLHWRGDTRCLRRSVSKL